MSNFPTQPVVAVIGGGPAGLMAAETLARAGLNVHLYEAMPSLGRKFLRAGVGGLNLTHSEPLEQFISRYSASVQLAPMLQTFGPAQMITWLADLGFETFTGTSGRVFPVGMKASPILRVWLKRLVEMGVTIHAGYRWQGFEPGHPPLRHNLRFETPSGPELICVDAVILALGGGSWPRLGSTGFWIPLLEAFGVTVAPLRPANCGFDVAWSEHFKTRFDGMPLKSITLTFNGICKQGEFIITRDGVEGSLIYALSAHIRDEIEASGAATIHLDLAPDWSLEKITNRLSHPRGSRSISSHIEKSIGLKGVKTGLLWEFVPREIFNQPEKLALVIKSLPIRLLRPRPISEAISSAGGIRFDALDSNLMLNALPGVFCAGEMIDWEAPTGGYLLTGCMSTARWAAHGLLSWLQKSKSES